MTLLKKVSTDIEHFLQQYPHGIVVFWWATATGKSSLSVEFARMRAQMAKPSEIISADSRQIFKYMNIGTDKVSDDILSEIPHHQINIVEPDWFYTAGAWKKDVCDLIPAIQARGNLPLIVGGTGLYIDTLYKNYSVPEVEADFELRAQREQEDLAEPWILRKRLYAIDPTEAKKHHPHSTRYIIRALEIYEKTGLTKTDAAKEQPVQWPMLMIWLWRERDDTNTRIANRVGTMIDSGLIEEVQRLLDQWYSPDLQSMQGIGYKETAEYLAWHLTRKQLEEQIIIHTQQYAKRQRTRFRRYISDAENNPKEGIVYKVYELE